MTNRACGRSFSRMERSVDFRPIALTTRAFRSSAPLGFTLVEVLVALGLTVVLLAAVYSSIHVTSQLSTAGRERMEQAQLVRALFQKIESDIRSVVFVVQEKVTPTTEAAEDEDQLVIEAMSTDEAFTNSSSGVFGDSQSLLLHINRPSPIAGPVIGPAPSHSEMAAVNYFLSVRGGTGLAGRVAQAAYEGALLDAPRAGTVTGLVRLEGDRRLVQHASESGDLETLATHARILAPEVVALNFSYWDGIEWLDTWDTIVKGGLPSAIAVTLEVDTSDRDADGVGTSSLSERLRTTSGVNDALPTSYRQVVALPLAEPFMGELVQ